jgi:hypothetical protein
MRALAVMRSMHPLTAAVLRLGWPPVNWRRVGSQSSRKDDALASWDCGSAGASAIGKVHTVARMHIFDTEASAVFASCSAPVRGTRPVVQCSEKEGGHTVCQLPIGKDALHDKEAAARIDSPGKQSRASTQTAGKPCG